MRCYFFRRGHIAAVEMLKAGSDEALVEEARALFEKRKMEFEGFEIWDCARFIYRCPELPPSYRSAPINGRSYYRLYLLGDDGVIRGYFDFSEDSDEAAYEIAELAFEACLDRAANFELWHDSRLVTPPASVSMRTHEEVLANRQAQIVALEERMRDSRWAVATSKRLLARLNGLKTPRFPQTEDPVI